MTSSAWRAAVCSGVSHIPAKPAPLCANRTSSRLGDRQFTVVVRPDHLSAFTLLLNTGMLSHLFSAKARGKHSIIFSRQQRNTDDRRRAGIIWKPANAWLIWLPGWEWKI